MFLLEKKNFLQQNKIHAINIFLIKSCLFKFFKDVSLKTEIQNKIKKFNFVINYVDFINIIKFLLKSISRKKIFFCTLNKKIFQL